MGSPEDRRWLAPLTLPGVHRAADSRRARATVTISAADQQVPDLTASTSVPLTGLFAYVSNQTGHLSSYLVNGDGNLITLASSPVSTGANPLFVAGDPQGKRLYVTDANSSTIYTYAINQSTGALTQVGLPASAGVGPNEIAINPSGTWLYVNCVNSGSVYEFNIDPTTGALTAISGSPVAIPGAANRHHAESGRTICICHQRR